MEPKCKCGDGKSRHEIEPPYPCYECECKGFELPRDEQDQKREITQGQSNEIDPLFAKSPDDARWDTIEDAFSWGETNQIIGAQIWNRAVEYERHRAGAAANAEQLERYKAVAEHYGDVRRWQLSDRSIADHDLYVPLEEDDEMLTHGFDFARAALGGE